MNPVDAHPSREQLVAFLGGRLSGADLASLSRHIEKCDVCCQALRELPDDAFVARLRDSEPLSGGSGDAPPRAHDLPAELLEHPRYKLGRFLGAGGMGAVYAAEHRLMDRTVALKIIHADLLRNPRMLERFRLEFKAAARLNHPNIVAAFDADQAGAVHFLVMEFVDGISLDKLIARRGPLEVATACNFVRQAAKGLQHAFEAGMVHRDIKPHNLMLTRKGQVKILDFGLARLGIEARAEPEAAPRVERPGLTRLGDVMGTPEYMAPEQITDPHEADIRADLYSLGCTLFFLLTGEPPFEAESALAQLFSQQHQHARRVSELRPEVPAELSSIVAKLLAKQPQDRYAAPADVIKVLAPFVKAASPAKPAAPPQRICAATASAPARPDPQVFLARCPFCTRGFRIPLKALGASIPCPHCNSYFTAVPIDDAGRP